MLPELLGSSDPPALASQSAGITGASHCIPPLGLVFKRTCGFCLRHLHYCLYFAIFLWPYSNVIFLLLLSLNLFTKITNDWLLAKSKEHFSTVSQQNSTSSTTLSSKHPFSLVSKNLFSTSFPLFFSVSFGACLLFTPYICGCPVRFYSRFSLSLQNLLDILYILMSSSITYHVC